ncbi:MAG TPA: hypothetical protein VGD26_08235, partial [Chitinophagaceae bacterium]
PPPPPSHTHTHTHTCYFLLLWIVNSFSFAATAAVRPSRQEMEDCFANVEIPTDRKLAYRISLLSFADNLQQLQIVLNLPSN